MLNQAMYSNSYDNHNITEKFQCINSSNPGKHKQRNKTSFFFNHNCNTSENPFPIILNFHSALKLTSEALWPSYS